MSSTKYVRGPSLAVFFLRLLQGGCSVSEMKARLDRQIKDGVITVKPSLPSSWRLRPMGFDGFMIETAGGYLNATNSTVTTGGGSLTGSNYLPARKPLRPKPNTQARGGSKPRRPSTMRRQNWKLKQPDGWQESRTWGA